MNPLDQLFQQKLEPLAVPPSPEAWNRIEANLAKKNNRVVWFRWAAGVGILLSLTGIGWYLQTKTVVETPVIAQPMATPALKTPTATNQVELPRIAAASEQPTPPVKRNPRKRESQPPVAATAELVAETTTITAPEAQATTATQPVSESATAPEIALVIEYILPPIEPAETAATEVEPTSLEKIKNAALELKYSEGWWGNLRMAKDDLLALNFKKDKNKQLE